VFGCDNVAQAPLPAASALMPTLVLRHRVTNREQVSRRDSELLMSWNVCEPRTWRGHSCLPRRDSSRRFSERSEKPRGHHGPVPSDTIGGVENGTKRKASTRVSTRQARVPAPRV